MGLTAATEFERIDRIRSITQMKEELRKLDYDFRKQVILLALSASRHQFTWSHFAKKFEVPETEWPVQPEWTKQA